MLVVKVTQLNFEALILSGFSQRNSAPTDFTSFMAKPKSELCELIDSAFSSLLGKRA
jgi:hypothetical protein